MNKQISLSGLMDELSQAGTKKREFLEQMDCALPEKTDTKEAKKTE